MFNILLVIHSVLCVILMGLVLIQQGKGADMGAAFGGNSTTLFGAAGAADFLTKLTTGIAIAFMVSSILLVRAYSEFETSPRSVANPLEGSVMVGQEPVVDSQVQEIMPEGALPQSDAKPLLGDNSTGEKSNGAENQAAENENAASQSAAKEPQAGVAKDEKAKTEKDEAKAN